MSGPFDAALSIAREFRRLPVLRQVYEKTDPGRRARRLVKSGLIDTQHYAFQLGVPEISVEAAADHYVTWGHWAGLSINGLIDDRVLRRSARSDRPAAYDYVWAKAWRTPVSAFWDVGRYVVEHPDALDHPSGPVGHLWDRAQQDPSTELMLTAPYGGRLQAVSDFLADQRRWIEPWVKADDLRRARRLSGTFHGVESMGQWPGGEEQPLVSIILATWNRSGPLRDAVESTLAQTWVNWELLIVDDGSWDDTPAIADLLSERDERVRYLRRPHEGVSAARNAGIAAARGEYITFLDSDNAWAPRFLENMMIGMVPDRTQVAFASLEVDNGDDRFFREAAATPEALSLGNVIDLNTLVVSRDALHAAGGFDVGLARAVDYDLILRLSAAFPIVHVPVLGAIYSNEEATADRISTSQPLGWNTHVRLRNLLDWDSIAARELSPGTSVVVIVVSGDPWLDEKLAIVQDLTADDGLRVHLAMLAPNPSEWAVATAISNDRIRAHLYPNPEPFSYVISTILDCIEQDTLVVVEPSTRFDRGAIAALADAVDPSVPRIVAPVVLYSDGTLVTAGAAFPKRSAPPVDLLSRHPVEDAAALGDAVTVPALSGRTFALPTRDLIAARGLDPLLYNEYELPALCLALSRQQPDFQAVTRTDIRLRRTALEADFERMDPTGSLKVIRSLTSQVVPTDIDGIYRPLGLTVQHFRAVESHASSRDETHEGLRSTAAAVERSPRVPPPRHLHPVVVRERRFVQVDGETLPRLRWALRIASPAFPEGGTWGDTHFARSLAKGLESWGQEVVIDHHEIRLRPTAYIDDVTLVLRGLDSVEPTTGGVSMLWVISHPDLVTRDEASRFDHVFAASEKWAAESSTRWGLHIHPLLQCTDPEIFHPPGGPRGSDIVFVGKSRGIARPAVVYPVRAGIPLRVFGGEWEGILPPGTVEAEYFPNEHLGELYGSAGAVLNDHWSDMRRDGFISNRLFDVVAAGGRVFSDRVEGAEAIFGRSVAYYDSPHELVEMLGGDVDALFAAEEELQATARLIRDEHSFRARARTLLDVAIAALPGRQPREGQG